MFIYFTDEEGIEYGIPIGSIVELKFTKAGENTDDLFEIEIQNRETYEVSGKPARKAFDEIKNQLRELAKQQGWRPVLIEKKTEDES